MRTAFIKTLFQMAQQDERIVLLVGDLGFGVVTPFMEKLPLQFVNIGVAEQNMTGIAAGMAMSGKIVFTYSIANFPVMRCLEQIRNDVCYHNVNVRVVSVGGGMAYGSLGPSHHATEDIAVMRALPNMLVVCPGDPLEADLATRALIEHEGPAYLRLGRSGEPSVYSAPPAFSLGKAIEVKPGRDITFVSTGGMLPHALTAARQLQEKGLDVGVWSMHTVKPLDEESVLRAAKSTLGIFTLEDHSIIGGLGSAVAEVLLEAGVTPRVFRRLGLAGQFSSVVGDQEYLHHYYGLDAEGIVRTVLALLYAQKLL